MKRVLRKRRRPTSSGLNFKTGCFVKQLAFKRVNKIDRTGQENKGFFFPLQAQTDKSFGNKNLVDALILPKDKKKKKKKKPQLKLESKTKKIC